MHWRASLLPFSNLNSDKYSFFDRITRFFSVFTSHLLIIIKYIVWAFVFVWQQTQAAALAAPASATNSFLCHKLATLSKFERKLSLPIHPIPLTNILQNDKLNKSTFKTCMYWFPHRWREKCYVPPSPTTIHSLITTLGNFRLI